MNENKMRLPIPVIAPGIVWMTILGNVQLALRHPDNNGPSRKLAKQFVSELGAKLVEEGCLTPEEWTLAQRA